MSQTAPLCFHAQNTSFIPKGISSKGKKEMNNAIHYPRQIGENELSVSNW